MKAITPNLRVANVAASVDFYRRVLGFEQTLSMPGEDGELVHATIKRGEAHLMFGPLASPWDTIDGEDLGKGVVLYSLLEADEDVDALFAHARDAGASVFQEPTDQFWGSRDFGITDPDGYQIMVSKDVREVSPEEMQAAMTAGGVG